jgi:hypothetical protein
MIILETVLFFVLLILYSLSLAGYGKLFTHKYKKSFFEDIFFGFIAVSFLITLIHFFFRISFFITIITLILGLFLFLKNKNFTIRILDKKNFTYLLILIFLTPIFLTQKFHEDFGYYHLPYVVNMVEEKIIFGLANSNIAYSHNSIWLNILSIFYLPKNNFNFLTLPTFILYLAFIVFSLKNIFGLNEKKASNFFILISVFYLIIKFTRLSEFGNDIPSTIFSILSIFYYLKFSETNDANERKYFFLFNFTFTIFAILIKFSCIPLLFLTTILFVKNYQKLFKELLKFEYLFIYFLTILFFFQQFIYTGCFVFPSKFSCLNISWFNNEVLLLSENLELTNKSYSMAKDVIFKEDYLKDFNWLPFWFERNYTEIFENILTMLIPICLLFIFSNNQKKKIILETKNKKIFFLFIVIGFGFWMNFSPVYRFSIVYFLSLIFVLTQTIYNKRVLNNKVLVALFALAILFNFTKNISRLSSKSNIYFGIEKINNSFVNMKLKGSAISINMPDIEKNKNGWQGRLCWDIPFLCTYNKINVNKKNGYLFLSK